MIAQLESVARSVAQTFGSGCEILTRDLTDLKHPIVCFEGDVTGRTAGGSMTDLGLAIVRAGSVQDYHNYMSPTDDGRARNPAVIFIRDDEGQAFAALCINMDNTPFLAFEHVIRDLVNRGSGHQVTETFRMASTRCSRR